MAYLKARTPHRIWSVARSAVRAVERSVEGYPRRWGVLPTVHVTAVGVYRCRNAETVREFIRGLPGGAAAHLHGLDGVADVLEPWTRSTGPGYRMPLLQGLVEGASVPDLGSVLLFDDDVEFARDGGQTFPSIAIAAGFDIAQPAHRRVSERTYAHTAVRHLSTARATDFVEVGPVVLLGPRALPLVLPFPPEARMGWGVDVMWAALRGKGLRLGIVDATPIVHLGAVGSDYDTSYESRALASAAEVAQRSSIPASIGDVGQVWRPWQAQAPWMAGRR